VPKAVTEALAVAGLLDHLARDRVHLAPAEPGRDRREALNLCAQHDPVDLAREL
jgi:hypothetical protein